MKGSRIHGIVRELRNENIDVVNYTENIQLLITRALSPAKITSVQIDEENNRAKVIMDADQVSLAIGRGGNNIGLAGRLTGYEIDVFRDEASIEDDVAIDEFTGFLDKIKDSDAKTSLIELVKYVVKRQKWFQKKPLMKYLKQAFLVHDII